MKNVFLCFVFAFVSALSSCSLSVIQSNENMRFEEERKLTLVIYMAADNDLESAALEDLNEMEAAVLDPEVTVLALVDRSLGYDVSDGNWSCSRLYEIKHDAKGLNRTLVSEQLSCSELGLNLSSDKELDMSKKETLSGLLSYSRRVFPAEHYALVMWGHGTGWRGLPLESRKMNSTGVRAFAFDDTSGSYMPLCILRQAIEEGMNGTKLDLIGFDTCFGAELEVCYELKNCVNFLCGTEGLSPYSGWNYTRLLQSLSQNGVEDLKVFFKNEVSTETSFSVVSLSHIGELFASFDSLSTCLFEYIGSDGDALKKLIKKIGLLAVPHANSEAYMSIDFFLRELELLYPHISEKIHSVQMHLQSCVQTHAADGHIPLGVYVADVDASGSFSSQFPFSYVRGSGAENQCSFVKDSVGYVPSIDGSGLLGTLFL